MDLRSLRACALGAIAIGFLGSCTITGTRSASPSPARSPAAATRFLISGLTVKAQPSAYRGKCPASVSFTGRVTVSGSGTITYRWERSDGSRTATHRINYPSSGVGTVSDRWVVTAARTGWERLHVLTPSDAQSPPTSMAVVCTR